MHARVVLCLAVVGCITASCAPSNSDDPDAGAGEDPGSLPHDQMLQKLGFKTDLGAPVDPGGTALPADYNPLRKPFGVLRPRTEVYVAGILWDNGNGQPQSREVLFDDKSAPTPFSRMNYPKPVDDTWSAATYKNGIAADLDGDGFDEFFIAYWVQASNELRYIILDPQGVVFRQGTLIPGAPNPTTPIGIQEWAQPALAKGDFAGIGRDQIAVGFLGLFIVNVALDGSLTVTNRPLTGSGWTFDNRAVFVGAGDLDGDKNDELAVSFSTSNGTIARYRIYDDTAVVRDDYTTFNDPEPGWGLRTVTQALVTIGDVDGDHLGEVVFYGHTGFGNGQVFVLDDLVHAPPPANPWLSFHHAECCWGDIPHPLAVVDFDGDGVKEVFAQHRVLKLTTGATTQAGSPTSTDTPVLEGFSGGPYDRARVAVGDVDADGKEDVIVETDYQIRALGLNALEKVAIKRDWAHGENTGGGWYSVIMATGNVDNDSAILKYDGTRELLFTNPTIVALVSSPPYWDGIGQEVVLTKSTFGTETGSTVEEETSLGFSVGWSVGTKSNFLFGEAEFKTTVEMSFDFSSFSSHAIKRALSYTTAGGKDLVVFTAVPFDVYYYTVQSSPEPSEVGTRITVNIPRKPQTIAADPQFFNDNTPPTSPKLDASVLGHALGNPRSYPTQGKKDEIATMPGAAIGPLATVPQSGTTTSTLELSTGSGSGHSMDLSVTFSWSVEGVSGPTAGGSVGFQYGYSYKLTTLTTTRYEGSVGAIPAASFADRVYSFGLMAYPMTLGQQKFPRLDYWVQ